MSLFDLIAGMSQAADRALADVFISDDHITEAAEQLRADPRYDNLDEDAFAAAVGDLAQEMRG